jgi:hypothetical protein
MWSQILMNPPILTRLRSSKFRRSFYLRQAEKLLIKEKGLYYIEMHARQLTIKKLKHKLPDDGKQTPLKGHPVFKAMHATATCCRKCLQQWHKIPMYKVLDEKEISYIISILLRWIKLELAKEEPKKALKRAYFEKRKRIDKNNFTLDNYFNSQKIVSQET